MTPTNLADFAYFRLIYGWMQNQINVLSQQMVQNTVQWISYFALILVTLWVFLQGYRLVTGQVRESAMTVVAHMIRIALAVTFATTVSLVNNDLRTFVTEDMSNAINTMVNGSSSMTATIDENLAYTQLAMAAIDSVQVPYGDRSTAKEKSRATLIATLGTAGPAITAGAMLLLYQVAMALIIGLAPLFILCLVFDQTKDLFRRWAMFTVSTLFSVAALNAMVAIALKATINTAAALWVSQAIIHITSASAEGFNSQALQQGGVGLLMTVLIISTPPMAAALFNGALGTFMPYAVFGAGGQGRRTTSQYTGHTTAAASSLYPTGVQHDASLAGRLSGPHTTKQLDAIKRQLPASEEAMARAAYGRPDEWIASLEGGSTSRHGPLFNTKHYYLDDLLEDAAYLANQNRQAQYNLASRGQDGRTLNNSEVEQAWSSVMQRLPHALQQIAGDSSLSFQERYDWSARLPGEVAYYFDQWHLAYQGHDGQTADHIQALVTQTQAYQKQYGLFDPKRSTLIANGEEEAGRLLGELLGGDRHRIQSLNPLSGQGMRSTSPFSLSGEVDRAGFQVVGTILVTSTRYFQNAIAAYGLHLQQENGNFDTGTLDSLHDAPSTIATSAPAQRSFAVAQGVIDATSFITDVRSKYVGFADVGRITVFEHDGKKYFEYVENSYKPRLDKFIQSSPFQDNDHFQLIQKGLMHEK